MQAWSNEENEWDDGMAAALKNWTNKPLYEA
jgi:hypothetical protein